MNEYIRTTLESKKNFIFLGEAGCGKTEIAVNFAIAAAEIAGGGGAGGRTVHFFDMDQTKPLFRSRDVREALEEKGVIFHYEEQFEDARTLVGGPGYHLADPESIVIMDIGGDHQGSRMIGGFAPLLKREATKNYFVINPYRPWSQDIEEIDRTMSSVLGTARLGAEDISVIANPNMGPTTTEEEIAEGLDSVIGMVDEYIRVECVCAEREKAARLEAGIPVMPLDLFMKYEWTE